LTEVSQSRRRFLRWLAVSALGAGVILTAEGLAKTNSEMLSDKSPGSTSPGKNIVENAAVSLLTIKVVYFLMAKYVSSGEEYFVLQSPALLRDLLNDVVRRHPSLAPMMGTMEILRDGAPVKPNSVLRDEDEVDFIPTITGG